MARVNKVQCNLNVSPEASALLEKLAQYYGLTKGSLLEKLVRDEAYAVGIVPRSIRRLLDK